MISGLIKRSVRISDNIHTGKVRKSYLYQLPMQARTHTHTHTHTHIAVYMYIRLYVCMYVCMSRIFVKKRYTVLDVAHL